MFQPGCFVVLHPDSKHPDAGRVGKIVSRNGCEMLFERSFRRPRLWWTKFIQWQKSIPSEIADAFADIERAWGNWTMPILNYFNHPVTNAYTESLNSLIRIMNRLGRGYSFEALRAKILFSEGAHKHKLSRPKFERRREPEPVEMGYGLPGNIKNFEACDSFARMTPKPFGPKSTESEKPEKNYGADISTLIRMIENGEL
jgi:hypothetical protein